MNQHPTISATTRIVLLWAGVKIDTDRGILAFQSRQIARMENIHPLNADPLAIVAYEGWSVRLVVERFNNQLDRLFYDIEQAFASGGGSPWSVPGPTITTTDPDTGQVTQTQTASVAPGKLYQYITEPDGSTTTLEFTGVSGSLADAGSYEIGRPVVQVLDLFASRRNFI